MESIRAWSGAVCMAALGCAAIQLLVPQGGIGRVFRLVVNTFFLCSLLVPVLKFTSLEVPQIDGLPSAVVEDLLEETVNEQLQAEVQKAVSALSAEALAARGVTAEKIEVTTDISDNGGIYIQHVVVTVDKQKLPIAKVAGEVLEKQLETTVTIEAM